MRIHGSLVLVTCLGGLAACGADEPDDPVGPSFDAVTLAGVDGSLVIDQVAADAAGRTMVGGRFTGTIDLGDGPPVTALAQVDGFFAQLDRDGAVLWWRAFGGMLPPEIGRDDSVTDLAVMPDGSVVVTGYAEGPVDLGGGPISGAGARGTLFVACYQADGSHVWSKRWVGGSDESYAGNPTWGPDGSLYVQAVFSSGATIDELQLDFPTTETVLVKLSLAGDVLWARPLRTPPTEPGLFGSYSASDLVVTGDALLISGMTEDADLGEGRIDGRRSFVMELDPSTGGRRRLRVYDDAETFAGYRPMARLADGTLVLGGRHVTWLAPDLSVVRTVDLSALAGVHQLVGDVAVTSAGEVVWVATYAVVRLGADGSELERQTFVPPLGSSDDVWFGEPAVAGDDRVLIVGGYRRAFTLGGQTFEAPARASGFIAVR